MELPFCKKCNQKFDGGNTPHILPRCGHSFCRKCLALEIRNSKDNRVVCTEDGQVA